MSVVVALYYARIPALQEAAQWKVTSEYIHVMRDTQDLPQQAPVYPVPGIFPVQLVFFWEVVVTPLYAQILQ